MKKSHAKKLRLETETVRALADRGRLVAGGFPTQTMEAGGCWVSIKATCGYTPCYCDR